MVVGYITRKETFSSAHRLHSSTLSDEENKALYGRCNHPSGHGHNYTVEVTLKGPIDSKSGMVMNIADLKVIIQNKVLSYLDHKNIDEDVDYFSTVPSTAENITVYIWNQLKPELRDLLYEVKLYETEKNIALYRGE